MSLGKLKWKRDKWWNFHHRELLYIIIFKFDFFIVIVLRACDLMNTIWRCYSLINDLVLTNFCLSFFLGSLCSSTSSGGSKL